MIAVELADLADCPALTATSKLAFDADVDYGAPDPEPGGPPGYDSVVWHRQASQWGTVFRLVEDGEIVGGAVLIRRGPGVGEIGRVWLVPQAQNRGAGTVVMAQLEAQFPDVTRWCLDTPLWNARTRHFYAKCGYREMSTDDEFAHFEKVTAG